MCITYMRHKLHMNMFVDSLRICVFCECCFYFVVDGGLYLSAAVFQMMTWPDPILE